MKNMFKFMALGMAAVISLPMISCSDDKDPEEDHSVSVTVGFKNVSADLIGGPTSYGENLYSGASDQITKGYIEKIYGDTYAQFPINYAEQTWVEGQPWEYTFFNGGIAVSNWHDMTTSGYENQLSVYSLTSPSGGNFAVAFGYASVDNPSNATLSDYDGCGRVYITDAEGYGVNSLGDKTPVSGEGKEAKFESVMIANTTYTYLVMKDGNAYTAPLNAENKGWFKVQFIAFNSNSSTARPVGYVEAYLANFDDSLKSLAGFSGEILDKWVEVDLSSLPEAEILVINFTGSDTGAYGLNTPGYCALDNFKITVEK